MSKRIIKREKQRIRKSIEYDLYFDYFCDYLYDEGFVDEDLFIWDETEKRVYNSICINKKK